MKIFHEAQKKVFSVCPRRFESLFVGLLCLFSSLSFHFGHVARLGAGVGWERGEKWLELRSARVDRCTEGFESFSPEWTSILSEKSFRKFPRKLLASKLLSSVHPSQKLSSQLHLGNFRLPQNTKKRVRPNSTAHKAPPEGKIRVHPLSPRYYDRSVTTTTNFFYPFFLRKVSLIPRTEWIAIHWIDSFSSSLAAAVNKIE